MAFTFGYRANMPGLRPPTSTLSSASMLEKLPEALNIERQKKYTSGKSELSKILKLYGPGYGKGMERAALAGAEENLISRGLGSTTRPVAASVGIKAQIEDMRRSKLAETLAMMAQYTQQSAPTPSVVSSTALGSASYGLQAAQFNRLNRPPLDFGRPQNYIGPLR